MLDRRRNDCANIRDDASRYQLATEGLDMTLKPGLAKHLKELEQKVFEMGSRSYVPGTTASSHSTTAATTTTTTTSSGGGGGGGGQSDAELPQAVQRSLKDMKFEAVRLKKAGDREGAKEKLRLVRAVQPTRSAR